MINSISEIPVTVFSELEQFTPVFSKGRCRLFYKGLNRNGTFISDEFAAKLIKTIPYVPIKGIYDEQEKDFTDHGNRRDLGRIYGIVPADPNFAWETHLDEDGVEREYACVDVVLYTALYKEASEIAGKAQSMELYAESIVGNWKIIDSKRCFVYEDACFLGCQVLGHDIEPCFEGAAFYTLDNSSLEKLFEEIDTYTAVQNSGQGGQQMSKVLFRLSDDDKRHALYLLLNPNVDENGYRIFEYSILDVYDDYAIVFNSNNGHYERAYYTKDDSADSLEITKQERCWIIDVNEQEKTVLENVRNYNNGTFEKIDEKLNEIDGLHSHLSDLEETNNSLNNQIVTMTSENQQAIDSLRHEYEVAVAAADSLRTDVDSLRATNAELASFKKQIEDEAKLSVIREYEEVLPEEVLAPYRENLDQYTCETLDMQLTYAQKKANPQMFNKDKSIYIFKDQNVSGGINSILDKYEKK